MEWPQSLPREKRQRMCECGGILKIMRRTTPSCQDVRVCSDRAAARRGRQIGGSGGGRSGTWSVQEAWMRFEYAMEDSTIVSTSSMKQSSQAKSIFPKNSTCESSGGTRRRQRLGGENSGDTRRRQRLSGDLSSLLPPSCSSHCKSNPKW